MPIYAYKCESCGHAKDMLQKISDEPLSVCPQCGASTFHKQVTAAGFQLKGSGWYVTDFRGGSGGAASGTSAPTTAAESSSTSTPAESASTASTTPPAAPAKAE